MMIASPNSKPPLVSIIMPAYNCQMYIQEAVSSLLSQTYSNIEIIIVDDGSTDGTVDKIHQFSDDRINLIRNNENKGIVYSLNRALSYCKGEFIARMDSDDICSPNRICKQVSALLENEELDICGTNFLQFGAVKKSVKHPRDHYKIKEDLFFQGCIVGHPTVLFRKKLLTFYDTFYRQEFLHAEDYDLWTRLITNGAKFENLQDELLLYRVHADQITNQKSFQQQMIAKKVKYNYLQRLIWTQVISDRNHILVIFITVFVNCFMGALHRRRTLGHFVVDFFGTNQKTISRCKKFVSLLKLYKKRKIIIRIFGSPQWITLQLSFAKKLQHLYPKRVALDTCLLKFCSNLAPHQLGQILEFEQVDLQEFLYPINLYGHTSYFRALLSKLFFLMMPKTYSDGDVSIDNIPLRYSLRPTIFDGLFNLNYPSRELVLDSYQDKSIQDIPVFINNFNRLTYTITLAEWFKANGFKNIYILDNNSNYPRLLDYYKDSPFKVIYLKENLGHLALWLSNVYIPFHGQPYIYTDPDLLPHAPKFNFDLLNIFKKYKYVSKIGPALKTDDLPSSRETTLILNHEQQFWKNKINNLGFEACIDTTMAIYAPYAYGGHWLRSIRLNDFQVHHLPWYQSSSEEEDYYQKNKKTDTHWGLQNKP